MAKQKELKDYINYYLGGKIMTPSGIATNLAPFYEIKDGNPVYGGNTVFFKEIHGKEDVLAVLELSEFENSKLILRPMLTVTEKEAYTIANLVYFKNQVNMAEVKVQKYFDAQWVVYYGEISESNDKVVITPEGKIGIFDPQMQKFMDLNLSLQAGPNIIRFFIEKQFDVFGLIKAGLAIDINTLISKTEEK